MRDTIRPSRAKRTVAYDGQSLRCKPAFALSKLTYMVIAALSLHHVYAQAVEIEEGQSLDINGGEYSALWVKGVLNNNKVNPDNPLTVTDGPYDYAIISETGLLNNYGHIESYGQLNVDGGTLVNAAGATIDNYLNSYSGGDSANGFYNFGTLTNVGTINNFGSMDNELKIDNSGVINNHDHFRNMGQTVLNNSGTLNNHGLFANEKGAVLNNTGTINNDGELNIEYESTFNNAGTLNNNGDLILDGDIYNSGTINGSINNLGYGILHNIGHGEINADLYGVGVSFEQEYDYTYSHVIKSDKFDGLIEQNGPGSTTFTGDSSAFQGDVTVRQGTLRVGLNGQGSLGAQSVRVFSGATLGGSGTVGSPGSITVIRDGGILAPGNSIGKLHVAGDLVFREGSIFQVEVDEQNADMVQVDGNASLSGTVQVQASGTNFKAHTEYPILSADKVSGTFVGKPVMNKSYEYLDPDLKYSDQDVTLILERKGNPASDPAQTPMKFRDAAKTYNQISTADALESLSSSSDLYQHIETLPLGTAAGVFDLLSGEIHATARGALLADAELPRERTLSHLRGNLNARPATGAHSLWTEVVGHERRLDSDGNAAASKQSTYGLMLGADTEVGHGWRVGAAFGYADNKLKVNDRQSRADIDSYSLLLTGGKGIKTEAGQINLLAGAGYTWHSLKTRRQIADSGLDQTLKASYKGATTQFFADAGYALPWSDSVTIEPFAGLAWQHLSMDAFDESGGSAALHGKSGSSNNTSSTLGVRLQSKLATDSVDANVYASLGWRHTFGTIRPEATLSFAGSEDYTIRGTPLARDAAVIGLGVEAAISDRTSIGLSYGGQFGGHGLRDHQGQLSVSWLF